MEQKVLSEKEKNVFSSFSRAFPVFLKKGQNVFARPVKLASW